MSTVKRYIFDLDKSAKERWQYILNDYIDEFPKLKDSIDSIINGLGIGGVSYKIYILNTMISLYRDSIMFLDELEFISKFTGIEFAKLLLIQLLYEANSACTCIITKINGKEIMIRTMDWNMPLLKKITIELEFIKNGKTLFIAPTWVGCVGTFTVHVPNKYSLAINYRRTKSLDYISIIQNIYRIFNMCWPVCYLIRFVAQSEFDYDHTVKILCESRIVSPCYVTVFNHNGKSSVITRGSDDHELSIMKDTGLIQTNRDDNTKNYKDSYNSLNILYSVERYKLAVSEIKKNNYNWRSLEELVRNLLVHPIVNDETIYVNIIEPNYIYTIV